MSGLFHRMARTSKQKRHGRLRKLRGESLENRRLLAVDFFHNSFDAEDVNDDGLVSAVDALAIINAMGRSSAPDVDMFTDVNNDGQRTAGDALRVINRLGRERVQRESGDRGRRDRPNDGNLDPQDSTTDPVEIDPNEIELGEVRSIDGTNNNLDNLVLGSAGQPLLRVADADYADGISDPAGADRPSPREISNLVSTAALEGTPNDRDLSAFLYVWGQFLDHDIDLSITPEDERASNPESFDVAVPAGDPQFDPEGTGEASIPFTRSIFDPATGTSEENPREQINEITAFVDGSQVYGSDQATADSLRSFVGGQLLITEDGLLPSDGEGGVLAGDIRAAENPGLTALQTLFVREHNRLAERISNENPDLSDEAIYQRARAVVIAEIQGITYNEFLPALLGRNAMDQYEGYDATVNPTIANEFSTAAFRFGHSTLNDDIEFFGNDGRAVADELSLAQAFFNPSILEETGIGSVLKYDASTLSQQIDLEVVDSLRNLLFGQPGQGGLDLVALNIQRGRDHGLNDYNSTREAYGLESYESFDQITSDPELQEKLASLYGDINNIDLWVGLLAEDHARGASVGELTGTIIADQFERLRAGDRFWYENVLDDDQVHQVNRTTLADIIEQNTDVTGLQNNVFFFRAAVSGTVRNANDSAPDPTDAPSIDADAVNQRDNRNRRRSTQLRAANRTGGVAGVSVELLDDSGNVVDITITDRRGNYRFSAFNETGDYQVRVANDSTAAPDAADSVEFLIDTGNVRLRGLDLTV